MKISVELTAMDLASAPALALAQLVRSLQLIAKNELKPLPVETPEKGAQDNADEEKSVKVNLDTPRTENNAQTSAEEKKKKKKTEPRKPSKEKASPAEKPEPESKEAPKKETPVKSEPKEDPGKAAPAEPEPKETPAEPEAQEDSGGIPDLDSMKKRLMDIKAADKTKWSGIKELITEYGGGSLSGVPEDRRAEFMEKVEAL